VIEYLKSCPRYNETSSRYVYAPEGRRVGVEWDAKQIILLIRQHDYEDVETRLKAHIELFKEPIWKLYDGR
jgi:hypothetical protein